MAEQQRYNVVERIAAGGMAEVYRAERAGLEGFKKKVAIKRVLPHLAEKKRFIQMFLDEARVSAHLSHSNCVQVFDVGVGDNTYFIVMEYVDGADLKAMIEWYKKAGKIIPTSFAVHICTKICEGLAYAHNLYDDNGRRMNIVHRDLSPPNVLITKFGEVKIVDFGLAKANTQLEKSEPGIIKGKFSYLSPEAAMGQEVDARTDVFAAAIILWEMLAGGRKLFQGDTDYETVKQVQKSEVPSIRHLNGTVDTKLEQIILRGLARDPATRYQSAEEMARALNDYAFEQRMAVSPFDIAITITEVVRDKMREKKAQEGPNVIDKLIEQTLFEFTSLDGGESGSRKSPLGNQKLDASGGAMVDIQDWGSELGDLSGSFGGKKAPSLNVEAGNLASLEDERSHPTAPSSRPPAVQAARPGEAAVPALTKEGEKKGGGGAIALVVVAIAVVGAAAAYFGGFFR